MYLIQSLFVPVLVIVVVVVTVVVFLDVVASSAKTAMDSSSGKIKL